MILMYFLITMSATLFFQGFFPSSNPNLDIDTYPPKDIKYISLNEKELYTTNITKTILIIIDALRLDFVNSNYMPLTSRLIHENGCFNKIKVEIPTVTLPRIKALTAGNVPQFIDLVLNLASTEILSDSIIHSAVEKHKKIVFYGDDTWLKLFPNKFFRHEGTNSFFVRDFTEVDDNVTRNVNVELKRKDWDMMILHYLGLDHIGHVYGPFSSLVPTKLKEMDNIVYESYRAMSMEDALLIVTGDHGMRDSGGHGGSTYFETNVPLLVIGSKCKNNSFLQTDLPVNLAVLLGLKIPSLAIGRIQKSLLQFSIEKYLYVLYYNNIVLNQKGSCNTLFDKGNMFYMDYLRSFNNETAYKAIDMYENCLEIISNNLAKGSVKQNLFFLITAAIIMLNCLLILLLEFQDQNHNQMIIFQYIMIICALIQFMFQENLIIFWVMSLMLSLIILNNIYTLFKSINSPKYFIPLHFFMFCCILHPITFLSSSYVEEEHQFWYFVNIVLMFFHSLHFSKTKQILNVSFCIILLATFRFLRTLNSTGDKWASYPDLSDWFLQTENNVWYQFLFISGLTMVFLMQYYLVAAPKPLEIVISFVTLVFIFVFKQKESSIFLGRLIWILILIYYILTHSKTMTWALVVTLLLKPYNLILIPYCILSSLYLSKTYKKSETIILYNSFLGNMLYFAQGHSNSLASVDISVGYIGLTSYQPVLVTAQVLCHTQAFPVLCHLLIFNIKFVEPTKVWKVLFFNRLYIFFVTSVITFLFRHHLFIWSVFAPKLFIEFINVLFLSLEYLLYVITMFSTESGIYRLLKLQILCLRSKIKK